MWAHPKGYCFRIDRGSVYNDPVVFAGWRKATSLEQAVAIVRSTRVFRGQADWQEPLHPGSFPHIDALTITRHGDMLVWGLDLRRCDGAPLVFREAQYVSKAFRTELPEPFDDRKFWMKRWREVAPAARLQWLLRQRFLP